MKALWTGAEIVAAMDGRPIGDLPQAVTGISIDSRTIGRGDAFFAIRGERFDGHDFASAATASAASTSSTCWRRWDGWARRRGGAARRASSP
jgi:UDP-N-acetylmuramoyl-tripeptide--D-alanyl-D-alanine ligase